MQLTCLSLSKKPQMNFSEKPTSFFKRKKKSTKLGLCQMRKLQNHGPQASDGTAQRWTQTSGLWKWRGCTLGRVQLDLGSVWHLSSVFFKRCLLTQLKRRRTPRSIWSGWTCLVNELMWVRTGFGWAREETPSLVSSESFSPSDCKNPGWPLMLWPNLKQWHPHIQGRTGKGQGQSRTFPKGRFPGGSHVIIYLPLPIQWWDPASNHNTDPQPTRGREGMDVLIKCSTSSLLTHSGLTARLLKGPHPQSLDPLLSWSSCIMKLTLALRKLPLKVPQQTRFPFQIKLSNSQFPDSFAIFSPEESTDGHSFNSHVQEVKVREWQGQGQPGLYEVLSQQDKGKHTNNQVNKQN